MSNLQESASTETKVKFSMEDDDSESDLEDMIDSTQVKQETQDYYDPVYFDTDEEDDNTDEGPSKLDEDQDDDEKEYDARAGLTEKARKNAEASVTDITESLRRSSIGNTCGSIQSKKHPTISNADLLYDPDEDDRDENWLLKKIAENRPPGCKPEDIWTDAILSCPMCLTQLCFDCQQHEFYPHQFRAMFIERCRIIEGERLSFPKETKKSRKSSTQNSSSDVGSSQEFKPSEDDDADAVYHPVVCEICNTKSFPPTVVMLSLSLKLLTMTGYQQQRTYPVHLTTPVTALVYHDNEILLSGQGPYLKAMHISTSETLSCIHLGSDWKVHRIVLANVQKFSDLEEARLFMVFGAKSLRIIRLVVCRSSGMELTRAYFQHLWNVPHMKDWIVDAQWLWPKEDLPGEFPTARSSLRPCVASPPTSIAIGYAHNFVEVFNLPQDPFSIPCAENEVLQQDNLKELRLVYSVQSEEHCTVFCGRFHNNTLEDLWFASGTVFCHALLWKVYHGDGIEAPIEKCLAGHEGILFGIRWSDDGKAVCTVSDDRTIRIWDITNPTTITHSTHFGHTARVWDCQIIGQYLISISEDASCRVWRNPLLSKLNDADDMSDCLACWEGHEGKSAWSVAVSNHGVVATGGGDGGIHLWRLDSIVDGSTDAEQNTKDIDLPDILTYYPDALQNEKEFVRDFVITSESQSVYATNTGYILVRDDENTWTALYHSPILRNYASMEASPCGRIVVAGCLSGKLVIVSVQNEFQTLIADTLGGIKVQFVFVFNGTANDNFRIVVFRANCTVGIFQLDISGTTSQATCAHLCDLKLPNNNKAIHAAYFSPLYNLILLGTRDGTVLVYNLSQSDNSLESMTLDSIVKLKRCHGNDSVSSILMVTEEGEGYDGKDRINVYTTGRDGSWTKYRFLGLPGGETIGTRSFANDGEDEVEFEGMDGSIKSNPGDRSSSPSTLDDLESGSSIVLQKIFRSKITRGWLERIFIMDGELLLLGFFNKKLFVYNESKHFETMDIKTFSMQLRSFSRELTAGSQLFGNAKLQNNFHGREVRHLRFLAHARPLADGSPAPIIVASGGEDCRLRMFQCAIESMRVWQVTMSTPNSYQVQTIEDHDGRIIPEHTPLSLGCLELAQCPHVSENLETRIMDLSVFKLADRPQMHFVASVYSDAAIRVWMFDEVTNSFVLAVDSSFHDKCILQVSHIKLGDGVLMFTAATDGKIAAWDLTRALDTFLIKYDAEENKQVQPHSSSVGKNRKKVQKDYAQSMEGPAAEISVHMSGVNSLYVQDLGRDGIITVSGGDDNALVAARIEATWDAESRLITVQSASMIAKDADAHGSAIQAVAMLNASDIVTTSQDQMISLWTLERAAEDTACLRKQETQFVHVPDPSAMDVFAPENSSRHTVAIAGIGIQMFDVKK
ncbi:WD repeat-containing protein 6 [Mortierella sp. GBA30]|nr:WD repeat-containing protein 6 [Mortierella sp. GBA30]